MQALGGQEGACHLPEAEFGDWLMEFGEKDGGWTLYKLWHLAGEGRPF